MNKDILYSTENSIQYLKITYNGKEFLKRIYIHIHIHIYIYMYIKKPNHFAVHLKLTQYCKSTILRLKKVKKERKSTDQKLSLYLLYAANISWIFNKQLSIHNNWRETPNLKLWSSFTILYYSSKTCSLIHLTRSWRKFVTSTGGKPEGRIGERLGQREGGEGGTTHSWGPPFRPPCIHTQSTLYRGPNTMQTPPSSCRLTSLSLSPMAVWLGVPTARGGQERVEGISRILPQDGQLS